MNAKVLFPALAILVASFAPGRVAAQYLYMDTNGNGVHDAGDRLKKKGPTTVAVYLNSNHNRDGSSATCVNAEPPLHSELTVFSFSLGFRAVGGTVSWGSLTDYPASFQFIYSLTSTPELHHIFYAQNPFEGPNLDPGLYFLGRLEVTALSGRPLLEFVPSILGGQESTNFGSQCVATNFDNSITLGVDFLDSDGVAAYGGPTNAAGALVLGSGSSARLAFRTSRAGAVRVQLFDVHERLVRTVLEEALPAGDHEVDLAGRVDRVRTPSSGVYFYRVSRPGEGALHGRLVMAR